MLENRKQVTIMDINFLNTTKDTFVEKIIVPKLRNNKKCFIVTANPEIVMMTREDQAYKEIVQEADYVVPDGAGILLAAKYQKEPIQERIAGYDLMIDLLEHADSEGLSCYFLGAKEETNEKFIEKVQKKFPNINIAGHHHGYFDDTEDGIANEIKQADPDLVFVALGMPRQEKWIHKYYNEFSKGLFMGVGGSFDVFAGEVKRAPQKWIDLNLEWLYRLLQQPFRIKRTMKIFEFLGRIVLKRY